MKRALSLVSILALTLLAAWIPPLHAQVWLKKDYTQWSEKECREILTKAPWANDYRIATVVMEALTADTNASDPTVQGREQPHVTYKAVFLSAKPVRQAMMRLEKLNPKYEQLEPAEQQAFEQRAEKFINGDFSNQIVIQLTYTTVAAYQMPLIRYWQAQPKEDLQKSFVLVTPAGRLEPEEVIFQPGGQGGPSHFQLIYPRLVNGEPVAAKDDQQINLEFKHPAIDRGSGVSQTPQVRAANRQGIQTGFVLPSERVVMQFKTKRMMVEGRPLF